MKYFITFVISCYIGLVAIAQSFTFNDLPWLTSPATANNLNPFPLFLNYRWVSSDIASNAVVSGNWIDRVAGSNWWMTSGSLQPTNTGSTNGIWFDESHYLTNNGLPISSNVSFGFIIKIIDDGRFGLTTYPAFLSSGTNSGVGGSAGIMLSCVYRDPFGRDYPIETIFRAAAGQSFATTTTAPLTNNWIDLIYTQAVTNNGTQLGKLTYFTNGVQALQYAPTAMQSGWGGFDNSSNTGPTNNYPAYLMTDPFYKTSIKGYVRELWMWSNTTNGYLDSGSISNFHYYRTNTYGP